MQRPVCARHLVTACPPAFAGARLCLGKGSTQWEAVTSVGVPAPGRSSWGLREAPGWGQSRGPKWPHLEEAE